MQSPARRPRCCMSWVWPWSWPSRSLNPRCPSAFCLRKKPTAKPISSSPSAVTDCVHYGKPVLGVNLGRTGFLATCEVEEMPEKLRLLAEGRYTLDPRGLLLARSANGWQAEAINDVVLFGRTRMHPMDYKVYCDGCFVSSYRSDGLILATPTGSTAYSFSAGGPVLDAAADVVVLTPVCAHNAQVAPLVFAAGRRLELVADAENRDTCYACADSTAQCDLQPGDVLTVTAAPQKLQLITFYDSEQFHAIENKLMRS